MVGEGVAAHERGGVGGAGPDDGDAPQGGAVRAAQRQRGAGVEQHDGALGQLTRQGPVAGGVEVPVRGVGDGALRCPLRVEQAELDLLAQQPSGGPVDQRLGQVAPADPFHQAGAEADGVGQLHVHAGLESQRARLVGVGGDVVHRGEEGDGPVVGDHGALEAPLVAEQVGEQPAVGPGRHAVHVGVGVHHRPGAGQGDRHLERREDHVHQLPPAHRRRAVVPRPPRGGVSGEVLEGGHQAGLLQPADVGRGQLRDQVGVLTEGLLDAAPAVVADDVEHGGEPLVHAERGHVAADGRRHPLDEAGVESGRPGQRRRVDGGAVGREPSEALLVHEGGDAEPGVLQDHPVLAHHLRRALRGRQGDAAVDARQVTEAVPARLLQWQGLVGGEDVLHRGHVERLGRVAAVGGRRGGLDHLRGVGRLDRVGGVAGPAAAELAHLLLQRHRGEEGVDPLVD